MSGFVIRIVVSILIVICGYHSAIYLLNERQTQQTHECTQPGDMAQIKGDLLSAAEKHKISARIYTCVKAKQNLADALFFDIPDDWLKASASEP